MLSDSDSNSEPRYLDQFSVQFGDSESIRRSDDRPSKRQLDDDPEVSAVLSDLLQTGRQGERRTFTEGIDFVRKGASNINDDIHAILSDILDGRDADYEDYQDERENAFIRTQLRDDDNKILKALRELEREEDERQRRPVRFGGDTNPVFSDDFANEGLRSLEDNSPNLDNRGRFDPSRPREVPPRSFAANDREPRQEEGERALTVNNPIYTIS